MLSNGWCLSVLTRSDLHGRQLEQIHLHSGSWLSWQTVCKRQLQDVWLCESQPGFLHMLFKLLKFK